MKHSISLLFVVIIILLSLGCQSLEGSFREGNPLRNPPAQVGIYITPFDVRTPYSVVGVVEARAFPNMWAPPLSEEDMYRELSKTAVQQDEKIDAIIQVHVFPYNTSVRRRGLLARGLAIRYLASVQGGKPAKEFFNDGLKAIKDKRYDDAIVDFLNCICEDPSLVQAHFNLAWLFYEKDDYYRALAHINAFIQSKPVRNDMVKAQKLHDLIQEHAALQERSTWWGKMWSGTKATLVIILQPVGFLLGL